MPRKMSEEKALRWREILNRQADSGQSVRSFCAAEGISEPSFYAWRKKLRERKETQPPRARRGVDTDQPHSERLFVPLKLLDATPTLEIIHPLRCRVRVTGDVSPVVLRHVIEALDERGAR